MSPNPLWPFPASRRRTSLVWFLAALFALELVWTAWICDDAFITFRVIKNFWEGDGLRWNIAERVQVYTHPLWMLMLLPFQGMTGEAYFSTLAVAAACSLAAFWILLRHIAVTPARMLLAASFLLGSRSFVDFSTSGLENPLAHLIYAVFLWLYLAKEDDEQNRQRLCILLGLALLNRLDHLLFYLPAIAHLLFTHRKSMVRPLLVGALPVLAWFGFALVYYGTPFPNTAYAKLGLNVPTEALLSSGLTYLGGTALFDPVGMLAITLGLAVGVLAGVRSLSIALGIAAYLVYTLFIGGDFMAGRFLSTAVLGAVALAMTWQRYLSGLALGISIFSFFWVGPVLAMGKNFGLAPFSHRDSGFLDERAFFYQGTGLLAALGKADPVRFPWKDEGKSFAPGTFQVIGAIGLSGYWADKTVHILDFHALSEPVLSRLYVPGPLTRVGHVERKLPCGYLDSLRSGINQVCDKGTAALVDDVWLVTRGDLFSPERWRAIYRLARRNPKREAVEANFNGDEYSSSRLAKLFPFESPKQPLGDSGYHFTDHFGIVGASSVESLQLTRENRRLSAKLAIRDARYRGVGVFVFGGEGGPHIDSESLAYEDGRWTLSFRADSLDPSAQVCLFYPFELSASPLGLLDGSDPMCQSLVDRRAKRIQRLVKHELVRRWPGHD